MPRYSEVLRRIVAVRLLRLAKRKLRYKDLEEALGIDQTLLARYISGSVLPGQKQAERIIETLTQIIRLDEILRGLIQEKHGYIDLTLLLSDIDLLSVVSSTLSSRFVNEGVTTVLVPETSGISLATLMAVELDASLAIARRRVEYPYAEYYEEHILAPPNIRRSFYLRKSLLKEGSRVLIVDDIVHTGLTLSLMLGLLRKARATPVGVASIVVYGEEWRRRIPSNIRLESILKLP